MRLRPQPCANIVANGISAARSEFGPDTIPFRRRFGCVVRLAVTVTRLRSSPFRARTAAPSLSLAREYYDLAPGSSVFRFGLTTYTTLKTKNMGSNNKRPASTSAAAPSLSKKRKTDNMQKYYAVQAGFVPGVYLTYSECQAQTAGFKGAICEWSFSGELTTSLGRFSVSNRWYTVYSQILHF